MPTAAAASVLLQIARARRRRCLCRWELRSDAEDCMDKLALRDSVALSNPAYLTLADRMHCLVGFDRSACTFYRSESKARRDPLLDEPMVLLDDVVQIGRRPAATATTKFAGLLQVGDRAGVGWMSVDVDHSRTWSSA